MFLGQIVAWKISRVGIVKWTGTEFVDRENKVAEMKITVNVPEENAPDYLRLIADQLEDGFTSGHYDRNTFWETETCGPGN